MKRIFLLMITLSAALLLSVGCTAENEPAADGDWLDGAVYFDSVILEANEGSLLVECTAGESNAVPAGSQVSLLIARLNADSGELRLRRGDNVRIWFDGVVMETYPLQLGSIYALGTADGELYTAG